MRDTPAKYVAVAVCCVVTVVGASDTSGIVGNIDLPASSAYVCPVEVSQIDYASYEASSSCVVPDEAAFKLLADDWRRKTRFRSNVTRAVLHPSHIAIVRMKKETVLPLIFVELRNRGGHWFWALETLTGVKMGDPGDSLTTIKMKWLEWAREQGYLPA